MTIKLKAIIRDKELGDHRIYEEVFDDEQEEIRQEDYLITCAQEAGRNITIWKEITNEKENS
jgi:hypothetical protein